MRTIGHDGRGQGGCICDEFVFGHLRTKAECPVEGHSNDVYSVAFSPDSKRVVSGSHDNRVKIWDVETGAEVRSFVGVRWGWRGDGGALVGLGTFGWQG